MSEVEQQALTHEGTRSGRYHKIRYAAMVGGAVCGNVVYAYASRDWSHLSWVNEAWNTIASELTGAAVGTFVTDVLVAAQQSHKYTPEENAPRPQGQ